MLSLMAEDIDKAKKLPPNERLRKLRQIAKQRENEMKEAQDLIKQSSNEILGEKRLLEEKIPIPQVASEHENILTNEELDIFETHRQKVRQKEETATIPQRQEELEETVEKEKPSCNISIRLIKTNTPAKNPAAANPSQN